MHLMCAQHILHVLRPGGMMATVMSQSVLFLGYPAPVAAVPTPSSLTPSGT